MISRRFQPIETKVIPSILVVFSTFPMEEDRVDSEKVPAACKVLSNSNVFVGIPDAGGFGRFWCFFYLLDVVRSSQFCPECSSNFLSCVKFPLNRIMSVEFVVQNLRHNRLVIGIYRKLIRNRAEFVRNLRCRIWLEASLVASAISIEIDQIAELQSPPLSSGSSPRDPEQSLAAGTYEIGWVGNSEICINLYRLFLVA